MADLNGTLHYHATIANAYVYQDAEGILWQVPMQPSGWAHRKPYRGYRQSLRDMPPAQQRLLANAVGITDPPAAPGAALAALRQRTTITCEVCGTEKEVWARGPKKQPARTCSNRCRQALWRRDHKPTP